MLVSICCVNENITTKAQVLSLFQYAGFRVCTSREKVYSPDAHFPDSGLFFIQTVVIPQHFLSFCETTTFIRQQVLKYRSAKTSPDQFFPRSHVIQNNFLIRLVRRTLNLEPFCYGRFEISLLGPGHVYSTEKSSVIPENLQIRMQDITHMILREGN